MKKRDVRSMLLAVVISLTMIGAQAAPVPAADLAMGTTAVEAEENEDPAGVEVTAPEHAEGTDLTEGTGDENGAGGSEAPAKRMRTPAAARTPGMRTPAAGRTPEMWTPAAGRIPGIRTLPAANRDRAMRTMSRTGIHPASRGKKERAARLPETAREPAPGRKARRMTSRIWRLPMYPRRRSPREHRRPHLSSWRRRP